MSHPVLSTLDQRPTRAPAPGGTARVLGQQPVER